MAGSDCSQRDHPTLSGTPELLLILRYITDRIESPAQAQYLIDDCYGELCRKYSIVPQPLQELIKRELNCFIY